MSRSRCH